MDCPTNGIEEEKRDFSIYETPVIVKVIEKCPSAPNPERILSRSASGCEFNSAKKLNLEVGVTLSRSADFENDSTSDSDNFGEALEMIAKLAERIQPEKITLQNNAPAIETFETNETIAVNLGDTTPFDNATLQENASVLETHLAIVNLGEEQLKTLQSMGEKPRLVVVQDDDQNTACNPQETRALNETEEGEIFEPVNFPTSRKWKAERIVPGSLRRPRSKSPGERASRQFELLMKEACVFGSYP